ncbi:MAG: hypothetical protein IJU93_01780, partial [Lachnospiraceae bacterium]|nr:hypothetical protein [Lachnospiraceae bacterium]
MNYKVQPIMYGVNDYFKSTIRFSVEFVDDIDKEALQYAAGQVGKRYPYFKVRLQRQGEEYVLTDNEAPLVISEENEAVCLGSQESNYHLLAFAYRDNVISVDVSHNICDGNGVAPLVKTLVYYYIEKRYGAEGIDTSTIRLVSDTIQEEEYLDPFPEAPVDTDTTLELKEKKLDPLMFSDDYFDRKGSYAYNLKVLQSELMAKAKTSDGSPVSIITVMMYRALMELFPDNKKDIKVIIPHEYRKALGKPLSHDSLARIMTASLSPKSRDLSIETLNTMVRGQIILGCDEQLDVQAINGQVQLKAYLSTMPLEEKKQTVQGILAGVMGLHTFGVSYTGNIPWGGMEKYIKDVHVYAGENKRSGSLAIEVFTCGEYFSICLMQPGKNPAIVNQLIKTFKDNEIECEITSEERFKLPDMI